MMQRYRKQRGELCNIIMKCFVVVNRPFSIFSTYQPITATSTFCIRLQKCQTEAWIYSPLLFTTAHRCYIKISIWAALPGKLQEPFEGEVQKVDSTCSLPAGLQETQENHGLPVTLRPEARGEDNLQPGTRAGEVPVPPLDSSAAGGTCRKAVPCNGGFTSAT